MSPRNKALLALALIVPAPTIGVIPFFMGSQDGQRNIAGAVLWIVAKVWLFALPFIWHVYVDKQRLSLSPASRGGFRMGLLTGLLFSAAIVGGYFLIGRHFLGHDQLRPQLAAFGLDDERLYLAAAAYWVLVNSVLEEYAFRWFIVRKCEMLMSARAAVAISALIFVVHHSVAMAGFMTWWINLIASLAIFVAGAAWSWLYLRYRSVWVPYLSHALADIAIFAIGWWLLFAR